MTTTRDTMSIPTAQRRCGNCRHGEVEFDYPGCAVTCSHILEVADVNLNIQRGYDGSLASAHVESLEFPPTFSCGSWEAQEDQP